MKRLFFLLFVFTLSLHTVAQNGGLVQGRVTDQATGEGLAGASIFVKRTLGTIASTDGRYQLMTGQGIVTVTCRFIGYKPSVQSIFVQPGDTLTLNFMLTMDVAEIDQVVVSANRIEQRLSELTVSMSLIKPETLSGGHISDAQELINKTPGIEVLDGQASIRGGSGFSYGAGSRVLALVDGLPILSADAGNIRWQFLPMDNISQIEIIKGASSVSYGSSALNGIINFRTADAGDSPVTRFYAETGVFGRPSNKNWIWWDTPRAYASASAMHLQRFGNTDITMNVNALTDNGYRRLNDETLGKAYLKVKHRSKKIEGFTYGLALTGGISRKTDFLLWENATTGALKHDPSTAIELHGSFLAIDPMATLWRDNRFKHDLRGRLLISDNQFPTSAQNNSSANSLFTEYQFWNKLSEVFTLNTGLAQNYSKVVSKFYGDHRGWNGGAFAQLDISPAKRLKLVSGVRLEFNSLDGQADRLIPLFRAGLNYQALDYTFLRASFGQGYRYPSIAEKHASTTLGAVKIFPNPAIDPESGWNTEIGIKQGVKTPLFTGQVDLALFYTQNSDMIEYVFGYYTDPLTNTSSFGFKSTNIESSRVYGMELEFVLANKIGRVANSLRGGYVYMNPMEINPYTHKSTGEMLKFRRKHSASLNLTSSYKKIEAGMSIFIRSRIENIDDVFLNELTRESLLPGFYNYWTSKNRGYWLADANIAYPLGKKLRLSLVVKNLTNTEYMGRPGDIQPHRNYSIRLSGSF